ncbi:MAG TPA: hypothetical protein VEC38_09380 [Candidatus Binataceae bacterium]|nr:hypothetical protein [Candidatus Binataceae bacterium]
MRNKSFLLLVAPSMILATLTLQSCFYGGGPRYPGYPGYAYAPAPVYVAPPPPVVVGAYDERHVWHDRDWWVANRRDWVDAHHHEWLEAREHHEPGHEYH